MAQSHGFTTSRDAALVSDTPSHRGTVAATRPGNVAVTTEQRQLALRGRVRQRMAVSDRQGLTAHSDGALRPPDASQYGPPSSTHHPIGDVRSEFPFLGKVVPNMDSNPARRFVSIAEAAVYSASSPRTIRRRIADGTLIAYRMGPRLVRVDLDDVDRLLTVIPVGGTHVAWNW